MTVLLIAAHNLRFMPYAMQYIKLLHSEGHDLTVINWDRGGLQEQDVSLPDGVDLYSFCEKMADDCPKVCKVGCFLRFRRFAADFLKNGTYNRVIVFMTPFAVLLSDYLIRCFDNRYIFDMRDPTFEAFPPYRRLMAKIVSHSALTVISSDGFRELLPQSDKIITSHNLSMDVANLRNARRNLPRNKNVINIGFWGIIRNSAENICLLKELGNDDRFVIHYYGVAKGDGIKIEEFSKAREIRNAFFHGSYLPIDKQSFIEKTDIILNWYNVAKTKPCVSNKYYDALAYYIPFLGLNGSYVGEEAQRRGIGIAIDTGKPFADSIFDYYMNMDWTAFERCCDIEWERVGNEFLAAQRAILEVMQ